MGLPNYPDKTKTYTVKFTGSRADMKKVSALITEVNNRQNSFSQTGYNYLLTLAGLASVPVGIASAAVSIESSSELEEVEDFYTGVLQSLSTGECSAVTVTQYVVGTWHGDERGYIYKLDRVTRKPRA
ncbi:hypothetical protein [Aminipila sp.]|uniref:hypothetical protein n=1 Tax=Aminipila sp. TaxID=2060095 RepID=UPI002899B0F9|nr:hypothetical protein [Aminipila sp.]